MDPLLFREQRVSLLMVKRFLKAFIRVVQERAAERAGRSTGRHIKEIPHHIYSFQKDVLQQQPSPRLLREELNELQRKINIALNQEKYIATIQEEENRLLGGMELPFRAEQCAVEKKLASMQAQEREFPTPSLPVTLPFPSPQLPAVPEPSFHQRIIAQVEQQLAAVEQLAAGLSKQKSVDKSQLRRIRKLISAYQKKIRQLKKKHAAA